jgi:hypothetical protein
MWYDDLGIISIGEQVGGSEDGGLGDLKIDLWRLFVKHCRSSYCSAVAHYGLALRVNGDSHQFGKEGIDHIRRNQKKRYIGADIVIPDAVWKNLLRNELRDYLARQVRTALQSCVARLRKDKEPVEEERLFAEVDIAIAEFTQIDFEK